MGICTKLPTISCCCGCTLKSGTMWLAFIYIIVSGLAVAGAGTTIGQLEKGNDEYDYNTMFASLIFLIVVYSLQFLLGLLLLWGTTQNKANYLLPYLWLQAILLMISLVSVIIAFFGTWKAGVGPLCGWLISLYFFMVVNSFYQEIK